MVVEELHGSISYAFLRKGCKPVHTQQQEVAKIKEAFVQSTSQV